MQKKAELKIKLSLDWELAEASWRAEAGQFALLRFQYVGSLEPMTGEAETFARLDMQKAMLLDEAPVALAPEYLQDLAGALAAHFLRAEALVVPSREG